MTRPLTINAPAIDAQTARGDWMGETPRAKFEGAKARDNARAARKFGKRN